MTWTELEKQSRRLVDQLRSELRDVDAMTLPRAEAAEMAAHLLDLAAVRELREDDPDFVREVVRDEGLRPPGNAPAQAAFDEALRASVLERMSDVMTAHFRERSGTPRPWRSRSSGHDPRPLIL